MDLSKRIGVTFLLFTSFALAVNLFQPSNPDYVLNVTMETVLVVLFGISIVAKAPYSGGIQVACLVVSSALAPATPGGPFFSSAIAVFSLVLIYAYGGFQTLRGPKVGLSFVGVFAVMTFNLSHVMPLGTDLLLRGFVWTMFLAVFCFILWLVVEEIDRKFHKFRESELLRLNRELIKLNHDILDSGGCHDATGKPSGI